MGVFVTYCGGDSDLEAAVERLGRRKRSETMDILPPRPPAIVSPQAAFLAALPGIGTERVSAILQWAGGNLAHALWGLTDTEVDGPVPIGARRRIRRFMGLKANEELTVMVKGENHE
ncbi:MAG: hypothetical protein D6803_08685 [Anaerolineae bacterium]|nr:MAG: hypothetical protein D6803_08685 [Anaerolineae bacterium]